MATAREELRERIERMSEVEAQAALDLLDDPVAQAFATAPLDDEPLTPEEEQSVAEGLEELRAGRGIPLAEVRRRLL